VTSIRPVKVEDQWRLPVDDQQVTRCCADYAAIRLLCVNMVEISIEQPFTLLTSDGRQYLLDPDGDGLDLAPILRLRRLAIHQGTASSDGSLALDFSDGSQIRVPASERYEAWNIVGPSFSLISLPGGGIG
jgi:Family of unknown function (DUF6188)